VVAHQKMMSGQTKQNICALIVKMMRNKMKEILKEGWDVFPAWVWAGNIFCIVLALAVILWI